MIHTVVVDIHGWRNIHGKLGAVFCQFQKFEIADDTIFFIVHNGFVLYAACKNARGQNDKRFHILFGTIDSHSVICTAILPFECQRRTANQAAGE